MPTLRKAADACYPALRLNAGNNTSGIPWWKVSGNTSKGLDQKIKNLEVRRQCAEDRHHTIEAEVEAVEKVRTTLNTTR